MQLGGQVNQDGTPASSTWKFSRMHQMFPQFMPPMAPMPAQNVVQPPPRDSTQRVPRVNPPRPNEYQLL